MTDIWDEDEVLESYQAYQEPINPHLAYTQGPAGQTIPDWKAFAGNPTPAQLEIHSTVEDRRDNRDPEQVWNEILEGRKNIHDMPGGFRVATDNGQMSFDGEGLDSA